MTVDIDVVVATHDVRRPAYRAVASAVRDLDQAGALPTGHRVRVSVVCHEVSVPEVRAAVEQALAGEETVPGHALEHVRYLQVRDGLRSPSGPFNAGIAAADGRYLSIIGSDDWFAPGALAAWARTADELGSAWLMARLETQDGQHIPTPRVRPGRTRDLDLVKDRLAYRTAPLGLLDRQVLIELGMVDAPGAQGTPSGPLVPGMRTGGDILASLRLASSGRRIDYGLDLPAYVIGTTGGDRITEAVRPITLELAAHRHLASTDWVATLPEPARRALVVKVLRIHVLGAVRRRTTHQQWSAAEVDLVKQLVGDLLALAPRARAALHRADAALVEAIERAETVQDLAHASKRRAEAGRWDILLARSPRANLDHESTLRAHLDHALTDVAARGAVALRALRPGSTGLKAAELKAADLRGAKVLILAFSPIASDARVLKQIRVLREAGAQVVTCGYGPAPDGVVNHIQVPDTVSNKLDGRLITARVYRASYWAQRAVRWVHAQLPTGAADLVLANDSDTLALALSLKPRRGVHADLHEYWPRWREEHDSWRARIGPYQAWLCRTYLPRCAAVTTVSHRIAQEYSTQFGVPVEVITNASPYADLHPGPVGDPVRLVHSGACLRSRGIHVMVVAVVRAVAEGASLTLDLYLTKNDPIYLAELVDLARDSGGAVRVHDPVPYADLFTTLNGYDLGMFVLPPVNFNYANALPNKIFDYVQARLGVLVGPSPDMAALVRQHQLGVVAEDFDASSVAATLHTLTPERVASFRVASHTAAPLLADTEVSRLWVESLQRIMVDGPGTRRTR